MAIILTDEFKTAFDYAFKVHGDQTRKGNDIPYISHLMATAAIVIENGEHEYEAIAALLHDAVEDGGGLVRLNEISEMFGDEVTNIVLKCSDTTEKEKEPWKERKVRYLEHLSKNDDASVLLVSLADKLHNSRCILSDYKREGEYFWKRFNAKKEDILWYYMGLLKEYKKFGNSPYGHLLEEYGAIVNDIEILCGKESGII